MNRVNTNPVIKKIGTRQNKNFPNNRLPVLIYVKAAELPHQRNRAATILQKVFLGNNWGNTWRNGIYGFHHFHSNTHECMGICSGSARVILGGPGGKSIVLKKGDIIIIPAGVAHKCSFSSPDFLCVGGYPRAKDYDTLLGKKEELPIARKRIEKLGIPNRDPFFGSKGFLKAHWA